MNKLKILAGLAVFSWLATAPALAVEKQRDDFAIRVARALSAGAVLTPDDLIVNTQDATAQSEAKSKLVGMSLKRMMAQNAPISIHDVRPPTLVDRNSIVTIEFTKGPLSIIAEGRALSAGAYGETIRVMNTSSKITLLGVVVGEAKVIAR